MAALDEKIARVATLRGWSIKTITPATQRGNSGVSSFSGQECFFCLLQIYWPSHHISSSIVSKMIDPFAELLNVKVCSKNHYKPLQSTLNNLALYHYATRSDRSTAFCRRSSAIDTFLVAVSCTRVLVSPDKTRRIDQTGEGSLRLLGMIRSC